MEDKLKLKVFYTIDEPKSPDFEINLRVQKKIVNEYNNFIDSLRTKTPDEIIDRAYEKVCKEEMVYAFEKKEFSRAECKALLRSTNLLEECYDEWLKSDGNFNELLEYAIDNATEHLVNDFNMSKKTKGKER